MHIVLCIWGLRSDLLFKDNYGYRRAEFFDSFEFLIFSYTLSVVSASKGLADFLLHGPCKLLPTNGKLDGMGTVGYLLLFLNIAATMVAKGITLIFCINAQDGDSNRYSFQKLVPIIWTSLNILPQLIIVSLLSFIIYDTLSFVILFFKK